jgi:glycerol uptake facilitator protein
VTNAISEVIGTFLLIFVVGVIFFKGVSSTGFAPGFGPYLVGCLVWAIGLSLGGPTGYAINPARDLGPRIAHALLPIAGKGSSDWQYSIIPVAAPLVGAAIAGAAIRIIHF